MPFARTSLLRLAVLVLVVVPIAAWWLVKPVRVVVPGEWAGLACAGPVCTDTPARLAEAIRLLLEARSHVEARLGPFERETRVIFCAGQPCADDFGLGRRSAVTLGTIGTVIGPRAWAPHYVRHELIHQAQGQRIGVLPLLFKPGWLVEGMAYGLSEDPRSPLAEPFESQRREFLAWYARADRARLWEELRRE